VTAPRPHGRPDGEAGQILLLGIAYGLLALSLVLVAASASAVHIERKQLIALADAAALDAADSLDESVFYLGAVPAAATSPDATGPDARVPLTDAGVRAAVAAHVAAAPAAEGLAGLAVGEPTGTPDGVSARVTLTAVVRPPFLPWALIAWSDGIALRATSNARAG
jgi:hypothetical protein